MRCVQILAHKTYGALGYVWPRYWVYHYESAKAAAGYLAELHEAVLALEPDDNNMRLVADEKLLQDLYRTGTVLVGDAVRAVQHLAEEIERTRKTKLRGQTVAAVYERRLHR